MKATRSKPTWAIHPGDCLAVLRQLPEQSVHCVVTSPPYYQLRTYLEDGAEGKEHEHGSEPTIEDWLRSQMLVFDEVRRVLRDDGLCWVNLGDKWVDGQAMGQPWLHCFAMKARGWRLVMDCVWRKDNPTPEPLLRHRPTLAHEYVFMFAKQKGYFYDNQNAKEEQGGIYHSRGTKLSPPSEDAGVGHKDFARDTPFQGGMGGRNRRSVWGASNWHEGGDAPMLTAADVGGANRRSVWQFPKGGAGREGHFAAFPDELPRICVSLSTSDRGCCEVCGAQVERVMELTELGRQVLGKGKAWHDHSKDGEVGQRTERVQLNTGEGLRRCVGWRRTCEHKGFGLTPSRVLDPYAGRGTTGMVALSLGRSFVGLELDPKSVRLCKKNLAAGSSLSGRVTEQDLRARQDAGEMQGLEKMLWGS